MDLGNKGVTLQGDANAIDGIEVNDSRSYHDSHDSSYQDSHNVTNIYNGSAAAEKSLADRKANFKAFCEQHIKNGLISRSVRDQLDDRARELNLEASVVQEIEQSVKKRSVLSQTIDSNAQWTLEEVKRCISQDSNEIKQMIPDLLELAERMETDEVQCYAYLVLAVENPSQLVTQYHNKSYDNYWMSFWTFWALKRLGNAKEASKVMTELSRWEESEANLGVLKCADKLYDYFANNADKQVLAWPHAHVEQFQSKSYLLDGFFLTIVYLLQNTARPVKPTTSAECNYYLRLFGVKETSQVVTPPVAPRPLEPAKKSNKKWLVGVIAAAVVLFWLVGKMKKEAPSEEPAVSAPEVAEAVTVSEAPTPASQTSSTPKVETPKAESPKVTTKESTPLAESSKPTAVATTTTSTTSGGSSSATPSVSARALSAGTKSNSTASATTGTTTTTPAAATATSSSGMSAAECLSQGRSALKRFQDTKALSYFNEAASKGSVEAYRYIGDIYYNGGNNTARNFSKAFEAYSRGASGNDADSQYMLGVMYRNGQGCSKSLSMARNWLRQAAAQGHTQAAQALSKL